MGRQHQGIDRPEVRQVPEGSGKQGKMVETGYEITCGAQTTHAVKGLMMTMMMSVKGAKQRKRLAKCFSPELQVYPLKHSSE